MTSVRTAVQYHLTIKERPAPERPREKLLANGAGALTNGELLAIILRTGLPGETVVDLANRLLVTFGGLQGLARATPSELGGVHGFGAAKACEVKACLELARRLSLEQPEERYIISTPEDVARLVGLEMAVLDQEQLRVVLLNTKNAVQRVVTVYQGSVNAAQLRVGEVFKEAIRTNAPALVVVHNHPSGDPTPSPDDVAVTAELVRAGKLLDVDVFDHIIIGNGQHVSLRRRGLGFGGR
ncbi:MAG: DNA repair protein RadC [Chloroflexi bacterium]|nr:DNA repair protein RadC [Chloroflexota bacterium]